MYYKDHIDHAPIGGEHKVRGDVLTTVFLTGPRDLMDDLGRIMRWTQDIAPDVPENRDVMRGYNNLLSMCCEV